MSGTRDDSLVLDDIVDATKRLIQLGTKITSATETPSREIADQVLWNLTVLGEATKRLPDATRARFSDVMWSAMAGTRDVVVHHYEGVDWEVVVNIIKAELPALLERLQEIARLLRSQFDGDGAPEHGDSTPEHPHA